MMQINVYSPQLEAEAKFMRYKDAFTNLADTELVKMYNDCKLKWSKRKLLINSYDFIPDEWHQARAAINLLGDRHGEEYVENLTGVKQPKTLIGKIIKSLF